MVRQTEAKQGFVISMLWALLISQVITFLALALLALMLTLGLISENTADVCILFALSVCVLIAGFTASRRTGIRGWLAGTCAGLFYTAFSRLIGILAFGKTAVGAGNLRLAVIGILLGAAGGIAARNIPRRHK